MSTKPTTNGVRCAKADAVHFVQLIDGRCSNRAAVGRPEKLILTIRCDHAGDRGAGILATSHSPGFVPPTAARLIVRIGFPGSSNSSSDPRVGDYFLGESPVRIEGIDPYRPLLSAAQSDRSRGRSLDWKWLFTTQMRHCQVNQPGACPPHAGAFLRSPPQGWNTSSYRSSQHDLLIGRDDTQLNLQAIRGNVSRLWSVQRR